MAPSVSKSKVEKTNRSIKINRNIKNVGFYNEITSMLL